MGDNPKIKFSIRTKLVLVITALLLFSVLTKAILFYIEGRRMLKESIVSSLTAMVASKEDRINGMLEQDFERVALLSSRIKLREYLLVAQGNGLASEDRIKEVVEILKEAADSVPSIDRIDIFDLRGKIISSSALEEIGKDMSKDIAFLEGQKKEYIGDVYLEEGSVRYFISAPLLEPVEEKRIGVIKVVIPMTRLFDILGSRIGLGDTGELELGRREGEDIVFISPLRHKPDAVCKFRIPIKSQLAEPMERAISGVKGFFIGPDYRGTKVLSACTNIPLTHWGLVAKIDIKEAFSPIEKLGILILFFSGLIFVLSIIAAIFLARFISQPIKILHTGTEIIAEGNLDYRVDVHSRDEIGQLANSFNKMTEHLKKITASRDELNKEIAKRRKTEEELREALRIKSDFTSTVSHELRTPLTAIKEGIGIVLDGSAGEVNEEQKDFLNTAKRNVDRLARLINNVLDFQKLESKKAVFNIKEQDINETINEAGKTVLPLANNKGLDFILKLDNNLPKIKFDKDKIIQVLTNLFNNSIKFTQQGSISIITGRGDNFIQVSVQDTGVGIKEEDMQKLFQEFSQIEKDIGRKTGGSGLGLVISKKIIEAHKGKIWAESVFGKGTTMHFTLPIKERRV